MRRAASGVLLLALGAQAGTQTLDPGALRVGVLGLGGRYTVTTLPIDVYVARVVAGEAARDSRPAALEALAITVRTYALANRSRHRAEGFDLCDQTHCQVVRTATAATTHAADATSGKFLVRDGAPASIYYTASCGGRTERPSAVWPGAEDPPFLPIRDDDACDGAPAWSAEIADADLARALGAAGFRGRRLEEMKIISRTSSGRVARLQLRGLTPPEISGQDLRVAVGRTLGWQYIKSTAFELRRQGDAYRFTGHGSGHGVGMCVIGSARLAERGETAAQILARYFPGLPISGAEVRSTESAPRPATTDAPRRADREPAREVAVSLPDEDEGGHRAIEAQAMRARDELARTLGVAVPRVTLKFHATVAEYERATGLPWYTSSTATSSEIHLSPIASLRDRGILDETLRRGLVHAMTDAALRGRPRWVRDGVALYYADRSTSPLPGTSGSCPSDVELAAPVSAGALSNAWARAKACVAKQIASGRSWRDVK